MLKLRDIAKDFCKKEIGNGRHISFWYDNWSDMGIIYDILGERGTLQLGIRKEATLEEAVCSLRRRRSYRSAVLIEVERNLTAISAKLSNDKKDMCLWRGKSGYKPKFTTKETWLNLRPTSMQQVWTRGVWYPMATPRFAFIVWLAMQNRLSTMDRISVWDRGVDTTCVLCKLEAESRDHLFFKCVYSAQLWKSLVKGMLGNTYSEDWGLIVQKVSNGGCDKKLLFCLRYAFHAAVYGIWRERNKVRHGESVLPVETIIKLTDKKVRNKLSLVKMKRKKGMEDILSYWFQTRSS